MKTEQEQRIWDAVFSAAQFEKNNLIISFDLAMDAMSAERAWTIADSAVEKFREWRKWKAEDE